MEENKETRVCNCCGKELPITAFRRGGYGVLHTCNECMGKKQQEGRSKKKQERDFEQEIKNAKMSRLQDFTPRDLMEELFRRGYTGKLKYPETVFKEIDISHF